MHNIELVNNIAKEGLATFPENKYHLGTELDSPAAILLRSANIHDHEIPPSLLAVGRAGAGVNNIPLDKMTARGIPVFNTPGANANAVKELVLTGMFLGCRNICQGWDYTNNLDHNNSELKKQVESGKKQFRGFEIAGKTLGVIGLGAIGTKVANAAIALEMKVIGYDPAMTVQNALELTPTVQRAQSLERIFRECDFITIHVPLIESTKNLISTISFDHMKKGMVLLNFSRDGIINNDDLLKALESEKVYNYICDFPSAELFNHPRIITLPHLGASTEEAEVNCAIMIAEQIQDFLENGNIAHSVNFPAINMPRNGGYRTIIVNENQPNMVGQITTTIAEGNINIIDMLNKSRDDIAVTLIDTDAELSPTTIDAIRGIKGIVSLRVL